MIVLIFLIAPVPKAEAFTVNMSYEHPEYGNIEFFWTENGTVCFCMDKGIAFNYATDMYWRDPNVWPGLQRLVLNGYPFCIGRGVHDTYGSDDPEDYRMATQLAVWRCLNGYYQSIDDGGNYDNMVNSLVNDYGDGGGWVDYGGSNWGNESTCTGWIEDWDGTRYMVFGPFSFHGNVPDNKAFNSNIAGTWVGSANNGSDFWLRVPVSSLKDYAGDACVQLDTYANNLGTCIWSTSWSQRMLEVWPAGTVESHTRIHLTWAQVDYKVVGPDGQLSNANDGISSPVGANVSTSEINSWSDFSQQGPDYKYTTRSLMPSTISEPDGGYTWTFSGWYRDQACTLPWTNGVSSLQQKHTTLYGKWMKAKIKKNQQAYDPLNKLLDIDSPLDVGDRILYTMTVKNETDHDMNVSLSDVVPDNTDLNNNSVKATIDGVENDSVSSSVSGGV